MKKESKVVDIRKYKETKLLFELLDELSQISLYKPMETADYNGPAGKWEDFVNPSLEDYFVDNNINSETEILVWYEGEEGVIIQVKSELIGIGNH